MNRYRVSRWSAPLTFALLAFARAIDVEGTARLFVIAIAIALFIAGLVADALDLRAWNSRRRRTADDR